jgi:sugar-specific transcriptional regulator TrmB
MSYNYYSLTTPISSSYYSINIDNKSPSTITILSSIQYNDLVEEIKKYKLEIEKLQSEIEKLQSEKELKRVKQPSEIKQKLLDAISEII